METAGKSSATTIWLTVYFDAVKLDIDQAQSRKHLGWFRDEVSAIAGATEHLLMQSSMVAAWRKLPELVDVRLDYRQEKTKRVIRKFKRATRIKTMPNGERKVLLAPGTWGKTWVRPLDR